MNSTSSIYLLFLFTFICNLGCASPTPAPGLTGSKSSSSDSSNSAEEKKNSVESKLGVSSLLVLPGEIDFRDKDVKEFLSTETGPTPWDKLYPIEKNIIESVKRKDMASISKIVECGVCLDMMTRDTVHMTKCGHVMHRKCYLTLPKSSDWPYDSSFSVPTCPM